MNFKNTVQEEKTLRTILLHRISELLNDNKELSFSDGLMIGEFIVNAVYWYRILKAKESGLQLSAYEKHLFNAGDYVNTKYGFNISIEKVQKKTNYFEFI